MGVRDTVHRGRIVALERPDVFLVWVLGAALVVDLLWGLATGGIAFSTLASNAWDGIMRGLVIGLAGIGLSMTYSILNFANFAHGEYITAGAFAGWSVTYVISGLGEYDLGSLILVGPQSDVTGSIIGIGVASTPLAVLVGLLVAGAAAVGLALLIDRVVYRPLRDEGGITLLITSIGVAFALRYLIAFVFDASTRSTAGANGNPDVRLNFIDGTVRVSAHDVTLVVVSVGLMLGVHYLLQRTKLGKAMRAMADNEDLARVTGIPTEQVVRSTWIVGGGLTGLAGFMLVLWKGTIRFNDGWLLLLLIFAAVIMGGIGSIYGAIAGGLVIGIVASTSVLWVPPGLTEATAFLVMILVLLFRPEGIFSGRSTA